jgi:hypothetical protein
MRVDGELSLLETVSLHGHLRICADCRAFAARAERIARELRSTPLEEPEVEIAVPRRRYGSFAALAPVAVATAAAAAVLLQATQLAPSNRLGPESAAARSDAAALRANYAEQRLARLFLNGHFASSGYGAAHMR